MTTISHQAFSADVGSAPLEPWPLDPAQIIDGDPQASGTLLWKSEDSTLAVGIWRCTPGSFSWNHVDETLVVIDGRATVEREDGGDPVELAPGTVAFFPEGLRTRWTVHETVRKGFHLHSAQPLQL
jgi:uncharacterized cupin superfamily protein